MPIKHVRPAVFDHQGKETFGIAFDVDVYDSTLSNLGL
jgi:hypothetical protein